MKNKEWNTFQKTLFWICFGAVTLFVATLVTLFVRSMPAGLKTVAFVIGVIIILTISPKRRKVK